MKKSLLFAALLLSFTGCSYIVSPFLSPFTDGAKDMFQEWRDGQNERYYQYNYRAVYKTTKNVLKKLHLDIKEDKVLNDGSYYIVAGNGDKFKITIVNKNNNITLVKIRVNFFGDQEYAKLIYDEIDNNLYSIIFN